MRHSTTIRKNDDAPTMVECLGSSSFNSSDSEGDTTVAMLSQGLLKPGTERNVPPTKMRNKAHVQGALKCTCECD